MPVFSNKVYNVLKVIVTLVLPGLTTLWLALVGIWNFPAGEQVAGTLAAINVFMGGLLHLSTATYNASGAKYDGKLMVEDNEMGTVLRLKDVDPVALTTKDALNFKMVSNQPADDPIVPTTDPQTYPAPPTP